MLGRSLTVVSTLPVKAVRTLATSTVMAQNQANSQQEDDVLFSSNGKRGLITLNRPRQLNALNHSMVLKIYPKLKEWDGNKDLIVVKGAGGKAFSVGGDILQVSNAVNNDDVSWVREKYRTVIAMDGLVYHLKTPYLALIHGIVMGGGVGISIHGKYRVATETSLFAMPETQIGLFPDVGVSHFLARMPCALGSFLALTGYRLKGYDLQHAGIATHFTLSEFLPELETALLKEGSNVEEILSSFQEKSITKLTKEPAFSLADNLEVINDIFSSKTVEEVYEKLKQRGDKFCGDTLKLLDQMSPLSLKVTQRQLQLAADMDVYQVLNQDYRLAWRLLAANDFYEGVRALLVDKDKNPKWKPEKLSDISAAEVDSYFKPINSADELNLPNALKS